MAQLIDGKIIAEKLNRKTAREVAHLKKRGITPKLGVVLVGDHKPSHLYVKNKERAAHALGIDFLLKHVPSKTTLPNLIAVLDEIQNDCRLTGIIIQLPLPMHLDTEASLQTIRPELDVDCLTEVNLGRLFRGNSLMLPPTPGAIMSILKELNVSLVGKNVTVVGTGQLVGRPLALILMREHATVTACNSKTRNLKEKCRAADILVSCAGKQRLIHGSMVKRGAIVIDTGIEFVKGEMYGDVCFEEVAKKASFLTPTPGGVGPITVALLLWNTVVCAKQKSA